MLKEDFTTESGAGTVTPVLDPIVVEDTPDDCQQSTKDARQKVIDTLLELNIAMTFDGWLREQLDGACDDRAIEIEAVTTTNLPKLGEMDTEKSDKFAAWCALEPECDNAGAFEIAELLAFNTAYTEDPMPVDPMITVPSLPANC